MLDNTDVVFRAQRQLKASLPNGDYVIFSPDGNGKPIVLSGVALEVYRLLEAFTPTKILYELHPDNPDWCNNLQAVLEFFTREGIIKTGLIAETPDAKTTNKKRSLALWIHVTDSCNLKCDYCYVHKGKRHLTENVCQCIAAALKLDVAKASIKEVELKFAGGEPLIDTKIILYLCNLVKKELEPLGVKIKLAIITNGTLVTQEKAKKLKEMGFVVMVSLDGLGDYNNMRKYADGRSSVDQVIHGIDTLLQVGIKPAILTTVANQNVDGLWELSKFARSRELTLSLSVSRDYNEQTGLKIDVGHVGDSLCTFLRRVVQLPKDKQPHLNFKGVLFEDMSRTRICTAGYNYFVVDPEANVCFCPMAVDKPLGSISHGKSFLEYSRKSDKINQGGDCADCIWKSVCCGGCEALAIKAGTLGTASVHCSLMKQILPFVLIYEGQNILNKET